MTIARPVLAPDGQRYISITDAAIMAGICVSTMHNRLRRAGSGWHYAEPRPEDPPPAPACCPVIGPDGTRYASIADAAQVANVYPSVMRQRLAKPGSGWCRDQLRPGDRINGKARPVIGPDGTCYASIADAAAAAGIARSTLRYRLQRGGAGWAYA